MSTAMVVVGNGRLHSLNKCLASAEVCLPSLDHYLMVNDAGQQNYDELVARSFSAFTVVSHHPRLGKADSIGHGWRMALETDADYIFFVPEDFVFLRPIPLSDIRRALDSHTSVAQMTLRRGPVDEPSAIQYDEWIFHHGEFSLDPSLIPRRVIEMGYSPAMTTRLRSAGYAQAFWGRKDEDPDVIHLEDARRAGWMQ